MRKLLFLSLLLIVDSAWAVCPFLESTLASFSQKQRIMTYKLCAEAYNDDNSQAKLAAIYDKGTSDVHQDVKKALYYYQLSSDNGNANSQARLAELYMQLDKGRESRAILYDYLNSITPDIESKEKDDFHGELVHPYVLLLLANEKPENKWYYPTEVKEASTTAKTLYKNYKIDDDKKKLLTKQATAWKKRKLLEMAQLVLSEAEYQTFVNTLYPATGYGDAFQRNQALKDFQQKISQRKKEDLENAKTFY